MVEEGMEHQGKEWVQKPQARKLSVGGVPPPRGLHGREFSEKLAEKVNGKGGYPPTDNPFPKTEFCSPKTASFVQKTQFWPNF